jgi:hypothetical protein
MHEFKALSITAPQSFIGVTSWRLMLFTQESTLDPPPIEGAPRLAPSTAS